MAGKGINTKGDQGASRISPEQREIMLNFMMKHPALSFGRISSPQDGRMRQQLWDELTVRLNACPSGTQKSEVRWCKSWQDWRSDVKAKATKLRRGALDTGGAQQPALMTLSAIEEKLLSFIAPSTATGVTGAADPLELQIFSSSGSTPSSMTSFVLEGGVEEVTGVGVQEELPSPLPPPPQNPVQKKRKQLAEILEKDSDELEERAVKATEQQAKALSRMAAAMETMASSFQTVADITSKEKAPGTPQDATGEAEQQLDEQSGGKLDTSPIAGDQRKDRELSELHVQQEIKTEMEWDYDINCGPMLEAKLGEKDAELSVEQHQPVIKREKEWDSDDGCGSSKKSKWGNDGDGPISASLEDGTGSSDGHCLSSSHTAGQPERVQKFGEPCPANYEESFLENEGDHDKVERLCRLCLAELNAFTYIFEFDDIHRFNVADAISDLLGMDLNPDDGLPTKICNGCLEEVAHFRRFKGKCFESKAKLKDMIDEKNYYDDQIKSRDGDSHLEAMEGEKNEIPIQSELAEADPRSGDVSMLETHVKREIVDSGEEEMEDCDMRNEDVNTFMESSQTRLAAGKVHEDVSHSSQHAGRVKVKKRYMIFCQPIDANDKREKAVEGTVNVSDSAQHIKNGARKKLGITSDSSSDLPVTISTDLVPVKTEISSADKNGADQQEYHSKGRKLAS